VKIIKRISLLLVPLATLLCLYLLLGWSDYKDSAGPGSGEVPALEQGPQHARSTQPRENSQAAASEAEAPRPPIDARGDTSAPVDADFDTLIAAIELQAIAGRVDARCALGLLLSHCDFLLRMPREGSQERHWLEFLQQMAEDEAAEPDRVLAQWDELLAGDRAVCERMTRTDSRPPFWNFIEAARRGHLHSMRRVLMGIGLDEATLLRDPLLYQAYRNEAGAFLVRLIERGDPWTARQWADALLSGRTSSLAAVIPSKWQTPGVAVALVEEIDRATGMMSSMQRPFSIAAEDQGRARQLFVRYFADSPLLSQYAPRSADELKRRRPREGRDLARPPLRACGYDDAP
jgi:hypothetical protein